MSFYQYYQQCPKERKTFLSPCEEEQLIQRLYTCPKVNLYSPRLYEDLPPLKFWNSPASTIENYLRRKVFHKRLQTAYEFNQTKDPSLTLAEVDDPQRIGTSEQLSNAMKQLAEDREYFEQLDRCASRRSEPSMNSLTDTQNENKAMWDLIKPPPRAVSFEEVYRSEEEKPENECKINIKKRFSDYQNFHRLNNLQKSSRPPLAITIGSPTADPEIWTGSSVSKHQGVSFYEHGTDVVSQVSFDEKSATVISDRSILKSPRTKEFSLSSLDPRRLRFERSMKEMADISGCAENELPKLFVYEGPERKAARSGTLVNVRDSFEVAHEKLSRVSRSLAPNTHKTVLSCVSLASHKDSISVLVNKILEKNSGGMSVTLQKTTGVQASPPGSSEELLSHEDSILLAMGRMHDSRDKGDSKQSCVCNYDRRSIQFACPQHPVADSDFQPPPSTRNRYLSILSKSTFLSAKDSLVVAHRTVTLKDKMRHLKGCQVEEEGISDVPCEERDALKAHTGIKGSKKQKFDEPKENADDVNMTPSKLREYLLESIQIIQVVPQHDGK